MKSACMRSAVTVATGAALAGNEAEAEFTSVHNNKSHEWYEQIVTG